MLVAGARPNFMKVAPVLRELKKAPKINSLLVHTGQHYDYQMSKSFFEDLSLQEPDYYLGVGSGTNTVQTAKVMIALEDVCVKEKPDLLIVVGDVNSTLAASLVSAKLCIKLAHVEAGLRSFDRTMPEEINRIVTDVLADYLFATCADGEINLLKEGIAKEKIFFVGNVMIDTLLSLQKKAAGLDTLKKLRLNAGEYALLTLHRPANVDDEYALKRVFNTIEQVAGLIPVVFPVHPRTQKQMETFKINISGVKFLEPLGYLDFLNLMMHAKLVITDSGGVQEETTVLGIPCLTMRNNTERPVTITEGTNTLVGDDQEKIIDAVTQILEGSIKKGRVPELWDGEAAARIVKIIAEKLA